MGGVEVHAAPHLGAWREQVAAYLRSLPGLPDLVGFATSGSSGRPPKMILFTHEALDASARGAVDHLDMRRGDWCCPLPRYHVGGYMIDRRAALTGARVHTPEGKWNAAAFARFVGERGCAWSSLVPAQVVDLVREGIEAPDCLRAVVVGGGRLERAAGEAARRLGWPVAQSYGMTEAASQVATARPEDPFENDWLPVLPHWSAAVGEGGLLTLGGPALFEGTVRTGDDGRLTYEPRDRSQPWQSRDVAELKEGKLHFLRRCDRVVKILGELADLDAVEAALAGEAPGAVALGVEHPRKGVEIVACGEDATALARAVARWNSRAPGFLRIERQIAVPMPRNEMGKLDRAALARLLE